jgi:hypothetical protein
MISCLTDYIGLRDVTSSPDSGRYVNELPGLSTDMFELSRKSESYDLETSWADVERRAIRKLEADLNRWAVKYFRNYSYIDNEVTGQNDNNTAIATGDTYAGWLFSGTHQYYKNLKLIIPWVEIHSAGTVTGGTLRIFNGATGEVLDSITYNAVAGINRITINKEYPTWKYPYIFIAYDESEITTIKATPLPFSGLDVNEKRVAKATTPTKGNLSSAGSGGQGLVVCFNLNCSLDNFVCQRRKLFEEPYMYLLGSEFAQEVVHSNRISQYTLLSREDAIELREDLRKEYTEMINGVLTSLVVDYSNDYCFKCDREVNYKPLLP